MARQDVEFHALDLTGDGGAARWAAWARAGWPAAVGWLSEDARTPQGARAAEELFATHMPELVPELDRLAAVLDRPGGRVLLTHAGLRPVFAACTQAGLPGALLRNYDWDPALGVSAVLRSNFLRPVLGMGEALWGLLDGMNDAGLAVSLTFGGRLVHGPGFAVPIVLRYLLETCGSVAEAEEALCRLPVSTAQNVTLVDTYRAVTWYVGPDVEPTPAPDACAANHQHLPVPEEQERATRTGERLACVREAAGAGAEGVRAALLRPPLYQRDYANGLGTVYTAVYRPGLGEAEYLWPGGAGWRQSFAAFEPGTRTVTLGA